MASPNGTSMPTSNESMWCSPRARKRASAWVVTDVPGRTVAIDSGGEIHCPSQGRNGASTRRVASRRVPWFVSVTTKRWTSPSDTRIGASACTARP